MEYKIEDFEELLMSKDRQTFDLGYFLFQKYIGIEKLSNDELFDILFKFKIKNPIIYNIKRMLKYEKYNKFLCKVNKEYQKRTKPIKYILIE